MLRRNGHGHKKKKSSASLEELAVLTEPHIRPQGLIQVKTDLGGEKKDKQTKTKQGKRTTSA